ncbi:uncharacterized protein LOC116841310 [Odontomachus brunneus]|uniref:uncharacterized protein LOC116841310 n=1 Tax=Odontomachus brunneus TaxID=486640 RepID=UPI0013F20C8C|nr:uncharacterized protein LOC116841310 [Odontomachus brunneus]XP_032664986.1 uncharacterized protein LOC116841310 [Odontomachus brunneus]
MMSNDEVNKRDHNYSESLLVSPQPPSQSQSYSTDDGDYNSGVSAIGRGKSRPIREIGQIKDIDELKKIAPRVRLQDAQSLSELTKISLNNSNLQSNASISDKTKQELKKYCRTCAGLKVPLVDIFSERGTQMRLNQQMRHLEIIYPHDNLSTQMCMDCICDLKMSYKFFLQIKKAQVKLKSIFSNLITSENAATSKKMATERLLTDPEPAQLPIAMKEELISTLDEKNLATSLTMDENQPSSTSQKDEKLVSPIFSLQDDIKVDIKESTEELGAGGIFEEVVMEVDDDDEDSIEEFDPEDPDLLQEQQEQIEIQEEQVEIQQEEPPAIYNYDIARKSYVRLEGIVEEAATVAANQVVPICVDGEGEESSRDIGQPNILKKRLLMPTRTSLEGESGSSGPETAAKMQKLDLNNPLSVNNAREEDGVMYVTVKGAKPNELLLVKVKKMDKQAERTSAESKSVERFFKRYETLLKDYSRKPDAREQIIEEQIEEYKRKREKVLGDQSALIFSLNESRKELQKESSPPKSSPIKVEVEEVIIGNENERENMIVDEVQVKEVKVDIEKLKPKLPKLQLEETNRKNENPQKESEQSCKEADLVRLTKILGEENKHNLQDFQEYLKQRKIIITRLKDDDIVSLYEDRHNSVLKLRDPFLELVDASLAANSLSEECCFECDYCPETFPNRELLEEHVKTHDYRIMHYCDDCGEEFVTNKAKRNHNIACLKKLICKYCDVLMDTRGRKRRHEQKHVDTLYGQLCEFCGERFKHQGTLDQHRKTQHTSVEKIYQCPKCPKKFAVKQKLSFHLKSVHTTLRAFLCEDCGADFKNPASLRHHKIRKHQPVGNKRECPVCRKLVPFYSLSKHMHTHKAYSIQCPHCDKMFKNSSTLKQHVRIHEDQRQYRCDTCGVGFNRRDGLRLHMRVHQKTDSRGLKECSCQVCGEKFPNHSTLVIHRNRVHKDGRQYTCHICNRSMISTRSLEWHMSHIHNESIPGIVRDESGLPEKKRVSCYHCNKTFKTEMILRTHIKKTHMEKDPMKCDDCGEIFTSEVRLRHHMMVSHNRLEGTLECPHCPKRFVNQLRLKTHLISHSEERPYTCELCGFNLKTKIQLIKHHQNRHSEERPLQCRHCTWRCKQVSALVCHERTHTNERPYACSVCRQRFKYLGDKNKHERRHESLGGSGFKRIVPGRNVRSKVRDQQNPEFVKGSATEENTTRIAEGQFEEQQDEPYGNKFKQEQLVEFEEQQIVKFEEQNLSEEYEEVYEQEYEETSREASEATEVIMNMEDPGVYTEEVTSDNIETADMITEDEIITGDILESATASGATAAVVHLQQQDDSGKIQVIPVMLSLPDLSDANAEVNLATASIMYNN